jgi:hypothetical protein
MSWTANLTEAQLAAPDPGGALWPCGHPLTPLNTQAIGAGRLRCRICRRAITRESNRRRRERERLDHPKRLNG